MNKLVWSVVFVVACGSGPVDQLEAITVDADIESLVDGVATVTGQDRDWTLHIGETTAKVHTPTGVDLAEIDGASVALETTGWGRTATWRLSDDDGPVWLAFRGGDPGPIREIFGDGFAVLGDVVGRAGVEGERAHREFRAAVFRTDDGDVELLPGDVDTLVVDGARWRVGVVAAYAHVDHGSGSKCSSSHEYLSYELLRVDEPVPPTTVTRKADAPIAAGGGGCG